MYGEELYAGSPVFANASIEANTNIVTISLQLEGTYVQVKPQFNCPPANEIGEVNACLGAQLLVNGTWLDAQVGNFPPSGCCWLALIIRLFRQLDSYNAELYVYLQNSTTAVPTAVRYGWSDFPMMTVVYNNIFPLLPFFAYLN
mgnify:CR=1 FL=1